MKSLLFGTTALMLVAGAALYAADALPAEGTKAPGFTLKSQEGKDVSLKYFKGKWVVLYFYPKDMTPGCTIEAHNFQRDQPEFDKKNAVIVGVSLDTVDSHVQFCTKENLTFKLLSDPQHAVTDKYGCLSSFGKMQVAARNTFLIDPKGTIRKVYVKVDPNPHSKEVLAALDELQKKSD
ncbi:MAG: peroxiredoxin [Bryobacteraceae bacterium]|jgi:peroxiredoxin Q/BCP